MNELEEKWESVRCPKCRRRLLDRDPKDTVGFVKTYCSRCKQETTFFIFKNKCFVVDNEFSQKWQKYLKKEFEEYIMSLPTE